MFLNQKNVNLMRETWVKKKIEWKIIMTQWAWQYWCEYTKIVIMWIKYYFCLTFFYVFSKQCVPKQVWNMNIKDVHGIQIYGYTLFFFYKFILWKFSCRIRETVYMSNFMYSCIIQTENIHFTLFYIFVLFWEK